MKEQNHTGKLLRDLILGGQDGLVNVLGVVLGVAAATTDQRIIIISGLAATFAESISMGAVAYTSMNAANDFYKSMLAKEKKEIETIPYLEVKEVRDIYYKKGFRGTLLNDVVKKITSNKKVWLDTMMTEELHMFPEEYAKPFKSGIIVFSSALIGSFIPLLPFFFITGINAMLTAAGISAITLFAAGGYKAKLTIGDWKRSGLHMLIIGMSAALAGFLIGTYFSVQ